MGPCIAAASECMVTKCAASVSPAMMKKVVSSHAPRPPGGHGAAPEVGYSPRLSVPGRPTKGRSAIQLHPAVAVVISATCKHQAGNTQRHKSHASTISNTHPCNLSADKHAHTPQVRRKAYVSKPNGVLQYVLPACVST